MENFRTEIHKKNYLWNKLFWASCDKFTPKLWTNREVKFFEKIRDSYIAMAKNHFKGEFSLMLGGI